MKKDANYYEHIKEKYGSYTRGNELLTIPDAIYAVKRKKITISLLNADVGTRSLIEVRRERMEETASK